MTEAEQPRLFEFRMGDHSPDTLVVAEANREAALLLATPSTWPGGALALVGPQGSGKTHLSLAWALEHGAESLAPDAPLDQVAAAFAAAGGRLVIDDAGGPAADQNLRDQTLIRALDLARSRGGAVLLTGPRDPGAWETTIPDLKSRLQALAVARLGEPDRALLDVVLRRLCRERFIELRHDARVFLLENMAQSFAAAHSVAEALDALVVRGRKPVTTAMAKKALAAAEAAEDEAE